MHHQSSALQMVIFKPQSAYNPELLAFLDSFFEVNALNYQDSGTEEYVGYIKKTFDPKTFEKKAKAQNITLPSYRIEKLADKDWLKSSVISFKKQNVADFCIYSVTDQKAPKTDKIPVRLYAATAFGSTHPTTHCCLKAASYLKSIGFIPQNILDVGTGSGILAICAAKLWQQNLKHIVAVDIDSESVNVAGQNVFDNHVQHVVDVAYSNGYHAKIVKNTAPYQLIFANILARPLTEMAKSLSAHLAVGGYAVLSGFVAEQLEWVINAHLTHGLQVVKVYEKDGWYALILQKTDVKCLQKNLQKEEALLVVRNNMFLSEDVLPQENRLMALTGFTGSAGILLITARKAYLIVDGRYSIQAKKEAKKGIKVITQTCALNAEIQNLCAQNHIKTLRVNPWVISCANSFTTENLDVVYDKTVPSSLCFADYQVFEFPEQFSGLSSQEKCKKAARILFKNQKANYALILKPEDVSFLSNLRAKTLSYTPVVRQIGVLSKSGKLRLFADFAEAVQFLSALKPQLVLADFADLPQAFKEALQNLSFQNGLEGLTKLRSEKNLTELKGFQTAHLKDGVAVTKFLYWLEHHPNITELEAVQKLHELRCTDQHFTSESFATIAASAEHSAVVHYQPNTKTNMVLQKDNVFLLDCGAQYLEGTTDATRTIGIGSVSAEIKKAFTMVLKAHFALSSLIFPANTKASTLDGICRSVLWRHGLDYAHGTGHGVGHFSNVHESGLSLSPASFSRVGMHQVTSIEPGVYFENRFGIRLENLYTTVPAEQKGFLRFENLTLIPIDKRLIDKSLLTEKETELLNKYHQEVLHCLAPHLNKEEVEWLKKVCSPL